MRKHLAVLVIALPLLAVRAEEPAPAVPTAADGDRLRISALIKTEDGVKVGIVDRNLDKAYYLRAGERAGDIEVISADYESEEVILRHGDRMIRFHLAGDAKARELFVIEPESRAGMPPSSPDPHDRDIYPDDQVTETTPPAPTDFGPGIEAFLKDNPSLAQELRKPQQGRYGSGIESMMKIYPDLAAKMDKFDPASPLGPAIEEIRQDNPDLLPAE